MERLRHIKYFTPISLFADKILLFLSAVRFQESIFALPFAYTGMVLAAEGLPTWSQFMWITVSMVSARTLGMAANRFVDRQIDARNPRTSGRHLPVGTIKSHEIVILGAVSTIVFFFAASRLNNLALSLSPVAAVYMMAYPYSKRVTWAANLMLGWVLAIAPVGAWIGVKGSLDWGILLLSLAVASWASAFDILYHVQDHNFYVKESLHSVAQRFGVKSAFLIARLLDIVAIISLVGAGLWMELGVAYFAGCLIAAGVMTYKYFVVTPSDVSRMGGTFMRTNAYVSITMLISTLIATMV